MKTIGQAINMRRQQRGMTIEKLAATAGISLSTISKIERGIQNPRISTIMLLAKALDLDPIDLIQAAINSRRCPQE